MLSVLTAMLCVLRNVLLAIAWGGAEVVNALVVALAAVGAAAAAILPTMPAAPAPPDGGVLGVIAWMYPVGGLLAGLLVFVGLWLSVLAVRAVLRWVRML